MSLILSFGYHTTVFLEVSYLVTLATSCYIFTFSISESIDFLIILWILLFRFMFIWSFFAKSLSHVLLVFIVLYLFYCLPSIFFTMFSYNLDNFNEMCVVISGSSISRFNLYKSPLIISRSGIHYLDSIVTLPSLLFTYLSYNICLGFPCIWLKLTWEFLSWFSFISIFILLSFSRFFLIGTLYNFFLGLFYFLFFKCFSNICLLIMYYVPPNVTLYCWFSLHNF